MFYSQAAAPLLWRRVSLEAELGSKAPRGKVQTPGSEHFLLPHGPAEAPDPSGHQDAEPGWAAPSVPPAETGADGTMAAAAAADSMKRIKAEATCSICWELLRDPVMTECGHSFCESCITRLCEGREDAACPQCRQPLPEGSLKPNQELKKIVELFSPQAKEKPAAGNTCERHQEPLKLFCNEDQTLICLVCRESQAHRGHSVVPKEEAVQEYREKIAEQLESIESSCGKLDQFVKQVWEHLPQNEREEEYQSMKRVSEKLTTVLQVHTGTPGQRFEDKASQTEPQESLSESDCPARDVSEDTERQGHSAGREPGSEREHGRKQASLDPDIHKISNTREAAQCKETIRQLMEGIESECEKLNQFVSTSWTYLSQSAREEEHQRLKRLTDNVATLLKEAVKETRKRPLSPAEGSGVSKRSTCEQRGRRSSDGRQKRSSRRGSAASSKKEER